MSSSRTGGPDPRQPVMFPHYSYPIRMLAGLLRDGLLNGRRRFADDAQRCIERLHPSLRVLCGPHLPTDGGCVITVNHYYRPGYSSHWSALAISAAVHTDVHWIMTSELTFPGSWIAPLGMPVSRWVLSRIARVYGFTTMPPMPPRARDVEARAAAVRKVLHLAASTPRAVIALAPEGGDQPGGQLRMPPAGVGRFCLLLAAAGLIFVPVGVYEAGGELILNFGEPYELQVSGAAPRDRQDRMAATLVMNQLAALLPPHLRGEFV